MDTKNNSFLLQARCVIPGLVQPPTFGWKRREVPRGYGAHVGNPSTISCDSDSSAQQNKNIKHKSVASHTHSFASELDIPTLFGWISDRAGDDMPDHTAATHKIQWISDQAGDDVGIGTEHDSGIHAGANSATHTLTKLTQQTMHKVAL